jgi:hypothetical protein
MSQKHHRESRCRERRACSGTDACTCIHNMPHLRDVVDEAFGAGTQQRIGTASLCFQMQAVETRAGILRLPRCMADAYPGPFRTPWSLVQWSCVSISRSRPLGFEVSGSRTKLPFETVPIQGSVFLRGWG